MTDERGLSVPVYVSVPCVCYYATVKEIRSSSTAGNVLLTGILSLSGDCVANGCTQHLLYTQY